MAIHGLCRSCGMVITYLEPGLDPRYHVTCGPNKNAPAQMGLFTDPEGFDPFNDAMARDLDEVVLWAHARSARSQQVMVGPSELGDQCDRKLAYRICGVPGVNARIDPWPALVGTTIHTWLEQAITSFQAEAGAVRWLTETEVWPDDVVLGHCDLFDLETHTVWDFKTSGADKIRKYRQDGPPEAYRTQVHLYGLGMVRAGHEVQRVGLIVLPRAGWLSGKWLWSEPYEEKVAKDALARMYALAERLAQLGADRDPRRVLDIPPTPSQLCSFCDFYEPDPGTGAGCPGK